MRWAVRQMILDELAYDEYNPNQPREPNGQWGSGGSVAVKTPTFPGGNKETDKLINTETKGTSAERVKMRNALKTETDPSKRKLLQAKVLESFEKQYKKTGDVAIGMKLQKYEKQYGMKAGGSGTAVAAPHSNAPLTGPTPPTSLPPATNTYKPGSFSQALKNKELTYGGGVSGSGEKLPPTPFTPEEIETFEALKGMSGPDSAKTWMNAAKSEVANGNSHGLTFSEIAHIKAYTGNAYKQTNSQLRRGTISIDTFKHTRALEKALDKLPVHKGEVGRKTDLSKEQLAKYEVGMVVKERGFTSSAKDKSKWSGQHKFIIKSRTGRDVSKLSSHKGETEVLFKPDTAFKVTKVEETYGGTHHIHMEELDI